MRDVYGDDRDNEEALEVVYPVAAPPLSQGPRVCTDDYLHVTHPKTGLQVVFVQGELLPSWVAKTIREPSPPRPTPKARRAVTEPQ